jgi:hypothetical protein
MKACATLLALFIGPAMCAQPTFQRSVLANYSSIGSITRDAGGNLYTLTALHFETDAVFFGLQTVKYDAAGEMVWSHQLRNLFASSTGGSDVAVTANGEVVVIGTVTAQFGEPDSAMVALLSADGELEWALNLGADVSTTDGTTGERIKVLSNGDILACGTFSTTANGLQDDLFLARISPAGQVLWTKRIEAPVAGTFNRIGDMLEHADGGLVLFGQTALNTEGSWLLKLSANGALEWCRKYTTTGVNVIRPLLLTARADGYDLIYNTAFPVTTDHAFRIRTDGGGFVQNAAVYSAPGQYGEVDDAHALPGGGFVMAGFFADADLGDADAVLFTTNAADAVQWTMRYGTNGYEFFHAVVPTTSGFLAGGGGQVDSLVQAQGGVPSQGYLVMTDANGHSNACEESGTVVRRDTVLSDITYFQTLSDIGGWRSAAVLSGSNYMEVAVCTEVNVPELDAALLVVHPNPANDRLVLPDGAPLRWVRVLGADGRLLTERTMLATHTLDIGALAPGTYVLQVLDAEGALRHGRFVKE